MRVHVKVGEVYGKKVVYPACFNGVIFAKLAKSKTLTKETLDCIKNLGYAIVVVAPELPF
jgi:hypothetical protein